MFVFLLVLLAKTPSPMLIEWSDGREYGLMAERSLISPKDQSKNL